MKSLDREEAYKKEMCARCKNKKKDLCEIRTFPDYKGGAITRCIYYEKEKE